MNTTRTWRSVATRVARAVKCVIRGGSRLDGIDARSAHPPDLHRPSSTFWLR